MTLAKSKLTVLDESFDSTERGSTLTRVYEVDPSRRVKVVVHRDFYEFQSHATASVLTAELVWTELAVAPPSEWWGKSRTRVQLGLVALDLLRRAEVILG